MKNKEHIELLGDNHFSSNRETPLRTNDFDKSDTEKAQNIAHYFEMIMKEMG